MPHAVALVGLPGTGKRAAAEWIVRTQLGLDGADSGPAWPRQRIDHADLHWVVPEEDAKSGKQRHTIGIEQVRDLIAEMALTSYEGRGKAAVIEPANAMTDSAANSLLKTLEEPSGNALIVLIVDRIGRLPATIFSRCQRIRFPTPPVADSLTWLRGIDSGSDWESALALAGGAPLAALESRDWAEEAEAMGREFVAVASGRLSPLDVADRWGKLETTRVLDWLAGAVQRAARQKVVAADSSASGIPDSVLRRVDTRNLFCYLDIINRLRAQSPGAFKPELAFESLLIDWADGLQAAGNDFAPGELLPG